jgi:hypothetical protein
MTTQNSENNSQKEVQERLTEIGQILYAGIRRLKEREETKNNLNQLDYEDKGSVHRANNNLNPRGFYE